MKKVILGILLMLLVACAPEVQEMPVEVPDVEEPVEEVEVPEKPTVPEPVQEAAVIDEEVAALIKQANDKVKSFSYVFVGPPENLPKDTYIVKGNKVKVEILKATDHKLSQTFTTVYLDTSRETVKAYCESSDLTRCPDGLVEYDEVEYDDHHVRTPMEWLNDITSASHAGNGIRWEQRTTQKINFQTEDAKGQMYLLDFYGMPAKILFEDGSEIEFRDLSINTVDDADVTPPN